MNRHYSLTHLLLWIFICWLVATAAGSAIVGWALFIGMPAFMLWAQYLARQRTKQDIEAAQIKFADLGNDTRFDWADDAGWLGKAVGTSHYTAALDRICATPGTTVNTTLLLVPEPNNPHDENAIAVCHSNGLMLGHLASSDNTAYVKKLRKAVGRKCVATANARVGCFTDEKTDERGHFIRLVPNDY